MKKAIFLLALAVLLICLVACNDHEHTFSDSEWANDTAYHWVGCTVEGCTEASERFEHAFGNPEVSYADGKPMGTLVSFNNVVKVTNGAISYIEADYYIGSQSSNYSQSFKYYNIGMSAVEVPQSVIDGCIPDDGSFDLEEGGEEDEGYHDQEKVEGETFNSDGLQTEVVEAN